MRPENTSNNASNQNAQIEPLLTIDEVCALLKIKPQAIYQLTYRGKIPHFKIANRLRFRLSEIVEWIDGQKVEKDSQEDLRRRM